MNTPNQTKPHSIIISERKKVEITGVTELLGYDDTYLNLETSLGILVIEGKGLHVDELSLDSSKINLNGEIDSLYYYSPSEKKSKFFSRLTK